jgi:hypothetical protein
VADINQLSSTDTLAAGDLLPIWRTSNGDTRKTSMTALQSYMQTNLTFPSATGQAQFVVQYAAPVATGFTVALVSTSNNQWLVLSPTGPFAAGTITFPPIASVVDNQEILIYSTQVVTALTISGNGATVAGAPASISANGAARFKYNALGSVWYRIDQEADPELVAIAALATSGLIARTGAGTAAARTVTGSTGLTVTNGDGVSGNPTLTLDATLAGISAVTTAADQLVYSSGVDTFTTTSFTAFGRTIAGSAQQSTTGTATGFTAGAGTNVTDASTFTGATGATAYRISDIVRALKNVGILAP